MQGKWPMSAPPGRGARFAAPAGRLDRLDHSPGAENEEAKCTKAAHQARPCGAGEGEGAVMGAALGGSWVKGGRIGRCRKMDFWACCSGLLYVGLRQLFGRSRSSSQTSDLPLVHLGCRASNGLVVTDPCCREG